MTIIYCAKTDCKHCKDICTKEEYGVCLKPELCFEIYPGEDEVAACADYEQRVEVAS